MTERCDRVLATAAKLAGYQPCGQTLEVCKVAEYARRADAATSVHRVATSTLPSVGKPKNKCLAAMDFDTRCARPREFDVLLRFQRTNATGIMQLTLRR